MKLQVFKGLIVKLSNVKMKGFKLISSRSNHRGRKSLEVYHVTCQILIDVISMRMCPMIDDSSVFQAFDR